MTRLLCLLAAAIIASCCPAADTIDVIKARSGMYKAAKGRLAPVYAALAEQILRDYNITEGVVVDVGCGPGTWAIEYAKRTKCTIYALDIDPDMIRLCAALAEEAGLGGRVIAVLGDAQNMPFRDEFADLVFSRGSIPWWQDRVAGLRECYRILKPGGVAYIGGGFSRILDPKIRNPIARWAAEWQKNPPAGFKQPSDLPDVARAAGIPESQWRFITEPIAGWWLEIHKPRDHKPWYRDWNAQLEPWHRDMAQSIVSHFSLTGKKGLGLEIGWGAACLAVHLARMTEMQWYVVAHDGDAAAVANELAAARGLAATVQALWCPEDHLVFADNTFDVVVGHAGPAVWEQPVKVLQEVYRVLKPGGVAFLGTGCPPDAKPESCKKFLKLVHKLRSRADAPERGFIRCPEPATLRQWLAQAGLQGTVYAPKTIHCKWIVLRK